MICMKDECTLRINGQMYSYSILLEQLGYDQEKSITLEQLIIGLGYRLERVAVEYNGNIVKRDVWNYTLVVAGAIIEIVSFVGGG